MTGYLPAAQLFGVALANLLEERLIGFRLIIGKGPGQRTKFLVLVIEGDLGVDAVFQVDSVVEILGRGQDQLGKLEVSGVQVDGPRYADLAAFKFRLDLVGQAFVSAKLVWTYEVLKGKEDFKQTVSHLVGIIVRVAERNSRALQVDGSEAFYEPVLDRRAEVDKPGQQADEQFYLIGCLSLSHVYGKRVSIGDCCRSACSTP